MTDFPTWEVLMTYAGSTVMVTLLVEFTKDLKLFSRISPQILSYLWAVLVLLVASHFTVGLSPETAVSAFFNAILVSLATNGCCQALETVKEKCKK